MKKPDLKLASVKHAIAFLLAVAVIGHAASGCCGAGDREHKVLGNWLIEEKDPADDFFDRGYISFFKDGKASFLGRECKWEIEDADTVRLECGEDRVVPPLQLFSVRETDSGVKGVLHIGDNVIFKRDVG